jgi:hypothetical protein
MSGCVGGDGTIRPTPTYRRSAAAGRARKNRSRTISGRGAIASRCCPGSRSRMARTPISGRHAMRWCARAGRALAGLTPLHPPQGPRRREVCRARGARSSPGQPLRAENRRAVLLCLHRPPDAAGPARNSHHSSAGSNAASTFLATTSVRQGWP